MRASLALAAAALLSLPPALEAQPFEGVITLRAPGTTRDGQPLPELEYLVRGERMRVNVRSPMGTMGLIAIPAEKKMFMLMDQQRVYMETPMDPSRATSGAEPKITRTGKTETIAGHSCEHVLIAGTTGENTDVCLAKGLGTFFAPGAQQSMAPWQRQLASEGAFPLRVTGPDGKVTLEATKIERKRLAPALFDVPDSYTKMDMPRRPPGGGR